MKRIAAYLFSMALLGIAAVITSMSLFLLPIVAKDIAVQNPEVSYLATPVLLGMIATVIPFVYAIVATIQIIFALNKADLQSDVIPTALQHIKCCAFTIITLYVAGFMLIASANAMPPMIALVGLIIIIITLAVALAASFLQTVVQKIALP